MEKIIVRGGRKLVGNVKIDNAKNAVLPIIAASILGSKGKSRINDIPPLKDVKLIYKMIESFGVETTYLNGSIEVNAQHLTNDTAPYEWVKKMRASFLVMGPLLARIGRAKIALPGGCAIGTRPIDQHLKGFEAMGADIELGQGYIEASVKKNQKLQGAKIYLDVASVGATENIMMAATMAEGTTTIENAAKEPEIVDLANYLNGMGAKVRGAGTGTIRIEGVEMLEGCEHTPIPDRIEAGTYMVAAAITGGDVTVEGVIEDHLKPVISKLQEMNVNVEVLSENKIRVFADRPLKSADIKTLPYPGFPTDMQSQFMALMMVSEGTSILTETLFENRFMHVDAFNSMNGNITVDGRSAIVNGGSKLVGSEVCAPDLRAGAALILAGLAAEGETEISDLHHVDRGYVNITGKLAQLGAYIERVDPEKELDKLWEPIQLRPQPSWA